MELHWGPRSQVYITPVAEDEVCVAVLSQDSKLRLSEALTDFPEITTRLGDAEPASAEMGALSVSRRLRSVYTKNLALIGDASGSVDAVTGEGICVSVKQANALTEALDSGDLSRYGREHRKIMRRPRMMGRVMLSMDRRTELRSRVLAVLAENRGVFRSLLGLHVGASGFTHLCSCILTEVHQRTFASTERPF
jgi:flavin-dependent dehydrogenase